jgi:enoyl-CoA hydratase
VSIFWPRIEEEGMSLASFKTIKFEINNQMAVISLNRPEVLNAINERMLIELSHALANIEEDTNVRVIILTAAEKGFSAGADIKEGPTRTMMKHLNFLRGFIALTQQIEDLAKPVIAAVNGRALGGGFELIVSCDFIIATQDSVFSMPEILLGVMPAAGGTQRLPRLIGRMKAKELMFTGRRMTVAEAEKLGLLYKVVPDKAALVAAYTELAKELGEKAPIALMQMKRLINMGSDIPISLALALSHEANTVVHVSENRKEGHEAFYQKRKPEFKGQ